METAAPMFGHAASAASGDHFLFIVSPGSRYRWSQYFIYLFFILDASTQLRRTNRARSPHIPQGPYSLPETHIASPDMSQSDVIPLHDRQPDIEEKNLFATDEPDLHQSKSAHVADDVPDGGIQAWLLILGVSHGQLAFLESFSDALSL